MTDISRHMEAVARALLGNPRRLYSRKRQWRYGSIGSLSVDLVKGTYFDHEAQSGGRVLDLVKREKGLSGEDAMRFLREFGCDLDGRGPHGHRGNGQANRPTERRIIAATFDYVDASGKLLFQTVRYNFKRPDGSLVLSGGFLQRRPNLSRLGEWIWNLDGIKQVPYRLVELNEALANDRLIVEVEGEAKVDRLQQWKIAATCSAQGSKKWRPEHSESLRRADALLLPDNDEAAGRTPIWWERACRVSPPGSSSSTCLDCRPRRHRRLGRGRRYRRGVLAARGKRTGVEAANG
jgi:hypothetical protein